MPRLMDLGLEKLTRMMMDMASLSEKTVAASIEAYQRGRKMAEVEEWSKELGSLHEQVSELSIELIARYQPVATDLRFIKACMEISYGFFRFGRYAHDIDEVMEMFGSLKDCDHKDVVETAERTKEMIRLSIEAFAERNVEIARTVKKMDDLVDKKYRDHVKSVLKESKIDLKCSVSATLILRYLERIADHATYIGDSVVYIMTGQPA